ncbi:MAG TPA: DUF4055 domain-containing protein, partial [Candidatus Obscuribacterales bacterium]
IDRYKDYMKRARFLNVTGRTKAALCGAVFRRDPTCELPTAIEYLKEDADGAAESLTQVSKRAIDDALITGRYGFLVDYPSAPEGMTSEMVAELGLRAHISTYKAESIINWKTMTIAGRQILTLVVLHEKAMEPIDEFDEKEVDRYRVLRLDDSMNYYQQVYDEHDQPLTEPMYARDSSGAMFNVIPFVFVGAEDNKPSIDEAPLSDLADSNVSWYQVSADHMENLHIHGQLTLGIASDMSAAEFKESNPNGVNVGSRAGHFLGPNGKFTDVSAPESSSLSKALEDIKDDMIAIGGRIIQPKTGQRTAEEARIDSASEMSILETLVGNVSEGIEKACEFVARFMGADPEQVEFSLNREFWDQTPDPQMLATIMGLEDRGHMAQQDIRDYLRRTGVLKAERSDEEIDEDVSQDGGIPVEPIA